MMILKTHGILTTLVALHALLITAPLAACSCLRYDYGFLIENEAELPVNARGVPWWGQVKAMDAEGKLIWKMPEKRLFRVERVPETGPAYAVPFTLELLNDERLEDESLVLVVPSIPLEPGMRFRLTFERPQLENSTGGPASFPRDRIEITIADEQLESDRVEIEIERPRRGELLTTTMAGSCAITIDAAQLVVSLPESVRRWGGALLYATRVDGATWRPSESLCARVPPGRSWLEAGRERLFARCEAEPTREAEEDGSWSWEPAPADNLEEGAHRVEMVAWLPGTDIEVTSTRDIRLRCGESEARQIR